MKVTFGPIVSDARGRFGGVVGSNWKGVSLFRRFQPPSNPNTANQQNVRNVFGSATRAYTLMTTELRAAWTTFAAGKAFIGRNIFIGRNVPALDSETDLDLMISTPGDASTIPPLAISSVTPGVGTLTVVVAAPAAPTGWTLQAVVAVAILDGSWRATIQPASALVWTEAEDTTDPYSILLSGLPASLHQVRAFIRWLAPDNSIRYSASLSSTGTPT